MINEIIKNINLMNIDNEYEKIANIYINKKNIEKHMLTKIKRTHFALYFEAYEPKTSTIYINKRLDKLILKEIPEDKIQSKYNLNYKQLINIIKLTYFMHELRHVYQIDNIKNKEENKSDIYQRIIKDFNESIEICPNIYYEHYDKIVIEKDAEVTSYLEIIELLLKIDDKEYNKILNYIIDYFLEITIPQGYKNKNLYLSTLEEMYNLIGKKITYQKLAQKLENISTSQKLSYNARLSSKEINMLKQKDKVEIVKNLIK